MHFAMAGTTDPMDVCLLDNNDFLSGHGAVALYDRATVAGIPSVRGVPNRGFVAAAPCAAQTRDFGLVNAWMRRVYAEKDVPVYSEALCGVVRASDDRTEDVSTFIKFVMGCVVRPEWNDACRMTRLMNKVDVDACMYAAAECGYMRVIHYCVWLFYHHARVVGAQRHCINVPVMMGYATDARNACEVIDWLVDKVFPDVYHMDDLRGAVNDCLWSAGKRGRLDVIRHMIYRHGANKTDEAFIGAAEGGLPDLCDLLRKTYGVSSDAVEEAMYQAVNVGHLAVCRYLVQCCGLRKECIARMARLAECYNFVTLASYLRQKMM